MLDEIGELSLRLSDEQENRRKLGDRLSHERHQFQRDKEATQEVSLAPGRVGARVSRARGRGLRVPTPAAGRCAAPGPVAVSGECGLVIPLGSGARTGPEVLN